MITIHLSGELATLFTPTFRAEVTTLKDVIDCLRANFPAFRKYLIDGLHLGEHWSIRYGNDHQSEESVMRGEFIGDRDVYIEPIVQGSDRNLIMIGVAVVAIAAGVFTGGTSLILLGVSLALSGVLGMMNQPKQEEGETEEDEPSVFFQGGVNTERQGGILPIVYGDDVLVGSQVLSFGLRTFTFLDDDDDDD